MRTTLVVVILALAASGFTGELPAPSAAELSYMAALSKATFEFEAKKKAAMESYAKALKAEQVAMTQKGDLDGALEVRDKLSEVEAALAEMGTGDPFTVGTIAPSLSAPKTASKAQREDGSWNLDVMGPEEWASIKAPEFRVEATKELDTGIVLNERLRYQIVPNPADLWTIDRSIPKFSWRGQTDVKYSSMEPSVQLGALIQAVALPSGLRKFYPIDQPQKEGRLMLLMNEVSVRGMSNNDGFIRVKIIKLK